MALTDNPEVAKFRESGGEYDPFAEAGDEADPFAEADAAVDPFADGGEVDPSAVEDAQALATVLGIDFKWEYIFQPHKAIEDAQRERDGQQAAAAPVWSKPKDTSKPSPALANRLAIMQARLAESERGMAARRLSTVLGIDFKWQYIFLPHLAIQDAVEERSHGPMMTLATPVAAPAKKATASPATLKKLAFSKGRLEETRRKIAELQRQQAAEDAQDQAAQSAAASAPRSEDA